MITININPVIFSIGSLSVRWYGLMYVVGITIGLLVAWPYAKWKGFTEDQLEKVVYWSVPAGLVGARLYYVIQQPLEPFLSQPWKIFAVWEGGMAFYGAIFAVVGQFFGRIGNIINGDIIGFPTKLPWGFVYANPNSFAPSHTIAYQPAAVYEALIDILLFAFLWTLRKKVKPGILFFYYIIGYSISQIIVFIWRDNEVIFLGLKQAQLTAIAVGIAAVIGFFLVRAGQRKTAVKIEPTQETE